MREISIEDFKELQKKDSQKSLTVLEIAESLNISQRYAEVYRTLLDNSETLAELFGDREIILETRKLAAQKQKYQDSNRIERKTFRDQIRMENALEALNNAVISEFDKIKFDVSGFNTSVSIQDGNQAIIQLSDTHFNELVDLEDNNYDFDVASKRMQLFAVEAKRILSSYGVEKVILAMTGDMINSDRRLDEKLNMATNRMTAAMISTNLIQYFINDLMGTFKQMDVVYVTGNESRSFEFGFTDMVVTDNYDSIIFNMLELLYREVDNVNFIRSNPVETVININGRNILILHGTTLGQSTQQSVQKFIGKYSGRGITIHYVIFGHIHFCNIGDIFARSGSLVGVNTYSDMALGLITKPSQNIHLITAEGIVHNFRIELQDTGNLPGYPIRKDLDCYNAKSASKAHRAYKVIEIERS